MNVLKPFWFSNAIESKYHNIIKKPFFKSMNLSPIFYIAVPFRLYNRHIIELNHYISALYNTPIGPQS